MTLLTDALEVAVSWHIAEILILPLEERDRIAQAAADVVASQGDTLQYGGGSHKFGHGARQTAAHKAAGKCTGTGQHCGCAMISDQEERQQRQASCTRCANPKCYCHMRGEASWSAGEVFNWLARGLAVLACQPGGVTFAGMHWCAAHPREPWPDGERICPACLREEHERKDLQ